MKRLQKKNFAFIGTGILLFSLLLLVPQSAHATVGTDIANFVGGFFAVIIWMLGKLLVLLIYLVVWVAQYNDFIKSTAVTTGWVIVRDICNMFFIVVLLVIAFATVLNVEKYSWKRLLPNLLIMAVLINFSKLICGVLIDFAQVVMLTFVNGFRDIAGGNFGEMFGIMQLLNVSPDSGDVSILSVAGTFILATLYVLVAIVVITVILFVLIMRIIMLWILVVLSPLAYLLNTTPNTEGYAKQWWKQFVDNLVSGPLLAFFIWLSFVTMQQSTAESIIGKPPESGNDAQYYSSFSNVTVATGPAVGLATAGTPQGMLKFVISIGLLVGGLVITKQLSGAAGSIASKGIGKLEGGVKSLRDFGSNTAKNTGKLAAQSSLRAGGNIAQFAGNKWNEKSGGKYGESLQKSGQFLQSWGSDIKKTRKDEKTKARLKTLEKLGMKDKTMDIGKEALDTKLGRSVKGGLSVAAGSAMMMNPLTFAQGAALAALGAGHIGGAVSSKWVGKSFKESAAKKQQNKNISGADGALALIEEKKKKDFESDVNTEEGRALDEIKKRKTSRDKALREVDDQEGVDIRNAINTNKPEEEIDAIKQAAFEKRTKIKLDADIDIDHLQSIVDKDTVKIKARIDAKYQPQVDELNEYKVKNQSVQQRDKKIQQNNNERANDLAVANQEWVSKMASDKEKYKGYPTEIRAAKLKEVDDKYESEKKKINSFYDELNGEEREKVSDTKLVNRIPKMFNSAGGSIEGYQPNRLTIDAMKLGSKEYETAHKSVVALRDSEDIKDFKKEYWSTPTGINSQQEKFLTILASNSADSKKALENMAQGLSKLKGKVGEKKDQDWLSSIMRGIATITDKKPETKNSYTTIIGVLDELHESKKVAEFKPKTK
jgi:hypothetical protein